MKLKHLVFVPLLLALAGCGSATTTGAPAQSAPPTAGTADVKPGPNASPAGSAVAQGRAAGAPAPAGAPNPAALQGAAALQPLPPLNRMIVKNANLSITVEEPEASLGQVDQLVKTARGTIASQTVRNQDDKTFVNMTIVVPADAFEDMLSKLRDLRARASHVLNDTVSSQDVTDQFIDLDAQYRNLQATRDAYQKLLDKATAVSDIITLTREVATIQTQMDQIKGRQNVLAHQSELSSITLSLSPVGATPAPKPGPLPKPVQAAQQAWQALLAGLQGFAVVLIWMGILLPIPAVLLLAGWLIYRRATRRGAPPAYQPEATKN